MSNSNQLDSNEEDNNNSTSSLGIISRSKKMKEIGFQSSVQSNDDYNICQHLTSLVAQQTSLCDKLLDTYRIASKEGSLLKLDMIPFPNLDLQNSSFQMTQKDNQYARPKQLHVHFNDDDSPKNERLSDEKDNPKLTHLNLIAENIDMIKQSIMNAVKSLKIIIYGHSSQEIVQSLLSQTYTMLNSINSQCASCKISLHELENDLTNLTIGHQWDFKPYSQTCEMGTQTEPVDSDSGSENEVKGSVTITFDQESSLSLEVQENTLFKNLKELTNDSNLTILEGNDIRGRKGSCPPVSKDLVSRFRESKRKGTTTPQVAKSFEQSNNSAYLQITSPIHQGSSSQSSIDSSMDYDISPGLISPEENFVPFQRNIIQPVDESDKNISQIFKSVKTKLKPKLSDPTRPTGINNDMQNDDKTISKLFSKIDEECSLKNQDCTDDNNDRLNSIEAIESEANTLKLQTSTNKFTIHSRKKNIETVIESIRKQLSFEFRYITVRNSRKHKFKYFQDEVSGAASLGDIFNERINDLVSLSQQFGAVLHEISHASEKEILFSFIDKLKPMYKPIANSNSTENVSDCENNQKLATMSSIRAMKAERDQGYTRGFEDGVECSIERLDKSHTAKKDYLEKCSLNCKEISRIINLHRNHRLKLILGSLIYCIIVFVTSLFVLY